MNYNLTNLSVKKNKLEFNKCFTLSEVLIALLIIGVVAAMTLPTLITTINAKIRSHQVQVIEKKLINGLNLLNSQENGFNVEYESTEKFLLSLSKYLKMSSVCGTDDIENCYPYKKINILKKDGLYTQVDVSGLKSLKALGLNENDYLAPAGFVLADGTSFIMAYKKECFQDPDVELTSIPSCIAGFYDSNGDKLPNKFEIIIDDKYNINESDIRSFNGISLGECAIRTKEMCISVLPFESQGINSSWYFDASGTAPTPWSYSSDSWAGAYKVCHEHSSVLPTEENLKDLAKYLYISHPTSKGNNVYNLNIDNNVVSKLGFPSAPFELWSDRRISWTAAGRKYTSTSSTFYQPILTTKGIWAFCIKGE